MLKIEPVPEDWDVTLEDAFTAQRLANDDVLILKDKIDCLIKVLKCQPIDGCITGSCMLPGFDPDGWGTTPDVDVFVFSESGLIRAIDIAMYKLGMTPGTGTPRSQAQEEWKLKQLERNGLNRRIGITTYKFHHDGVMLNITHKMRRAEGRWVPLASTADVLQSFDMSIVMQGYDIMNHVTYDMRVGDPYVAIPNPLRDHNCVMWTVAKWVRQFDRVVKYYGRGFDTRPMARFYLDMIDECIEVGCLFDSEESKEAFASFSDEFLEKRAQIADWYEAHKED